MKFNIGDIITGVDNSPYCVTDNRGTYKVIHINGSGYIRISVVEHNDLNEIGAEYDVDPEWFVYSKGFVHWEGIFNKAYNQKTFRVKDGIPMVDGVSVDSPCYKQLCDEYTKYVKSMEKEK